jgi:hypothetical protein
MEVFKIIVAETNGDYDFSQHPQANVHSGINGPKQKKY